jgi:hypothetical protein
MDEVHMFDTTKQKSAELKDEMVRRTARAAAESAEKVAVGTQKTADSLRKWADELDRSTRSRARTYIGLGILAVLIAIVVYRVSSKNRERPDQVQEIGSDPVDRGVG